ncbi:hypothetical protein KAT36_01615 [Candidatus Pacearchaeota archaeon]|nr:hypothetical protein [Candidatus Pacearchaeota archaeon]
MGAEMSASHSNGQWAMGNGHVALCRALGRKRGQVTIFIIVGIVIVVGIIAFAFLMRDVDIGPKPDIDPKNIVRSCVNDLVKDSIDKMLMNGGEILPTRAISYEGAEWNYLCYQADFYQGCYNIHPMLEIQIEKEIEKDSLSGVQNCFDVMRQDLENRGFSVGGGATDYSIDLLPGYVDVKLEKRVEISKEGSSQVFDDFGFEVVSPIYDLVRVARLIVNDESQFCNFEYNGYMLLYPKYDIRRIDYRDSKIYRLIDRRSGDEFRFAIRSCAFAPGI